MKKCQSSIEFIINYGWMILIIIIAGFLLFQLGVFNSGDFTGFKVRGLSNFHIQDAVLDSEGNLSILLAFKSNDYFTITNIAFDVLDEDCAGDEAFNQRVESKLVELNTQALSACNIDSNHAKINISIMYVSRRGLERVERGEIYLSVNQNQSLIIVPEIELELSNVLNSSITNESATISWDTNKLANSTVIYGQTLAMGEGSNSSSSLTQSHSLLVSNLLPDTSYYYNLTSCNDSCKTVGPYYFQTMENIAVPGIVDILILSPENTTYNNASILVNISSSGVYTWYNWNGANMTYVGEINITFNEWVNNLLAWANDSAGNINFSSVYFTVNTTYNISRLNYTLFYEDFTPAPFYDYNWTRTGARWISESGSVCFGGSGDCARSDNCNENNDFITTNSGLINLSNSNNAFLEFYARRAGPVGLQAGQNLRAWCYNGTSWINFYTVLSTQLTTSHILQASVIPSECRIGDARFRMTFVSNNNNRRVIVDEFKIIKEVLE